MADALGPLKQVVDVALMIKDAVDTVRQNKEDCLQIGKRVNRLRAILSKLDDMDVRKDPAMRDALKDFEETLRRAYTLITVCQEEKSTISLFFTAGKLSKQLRQVNDDILAQMAVANFGNNVQNTVMFTRRSQNEVHPPSPKDQEHLGPASLFREETEEAVSSYSSHPQHDARLEASDNDTERAPVIKVPFRIPEMPRTSLPWFTIFTYSQLKHATKKFSYMVGKGAFATVYKGTLSDGLEVAVKRFEGRHSDIHIREQFENEVRLAAKLQHINIMKLLGCYSTKEEYFVVYEFMPNGSLSDHIHGNRDSALPWPIRFQIVEGIAQGALYLHKHCGLRIIHKDLKPANIMLDAGYNPNIGDFGNSEALPQFEDHDSSMYVIGTRGFLAPEYMNCGTFSVKTDVYSYGVLLLETISGKHSQEETADFNTLTAWVWQLWKRRKLTQCIDPRLGDVSDVSVAKEIERCIHIALLCVEEDPALRPTMSDVLEMLGGKKQKLPIPKKPAYTTEDSSDNYEQED